MNHRRSGHYKLKAPRGAYSDRFGPRLVRQAAPPFRTAAGAAEPWRKDWPALGLPAATLLPGGTVICRP